MADLTFAIVGSGHFHTMAKRKSIARRLGDSKNLEFVIARRLLSAVLGFSVAYAYHRVSFSHAFAADEEYWADAVKWGVLTTATVGCTLSTQCSCIAVLCIPTMCTKSGRSMLQALIVSWILAGPMSNIMYHMTEAMRSMSCLSELSDRQSRVLSDLIKAPIEKGLFRIVDQSGNLDKAEDELQGELTDLQKKILVTALGEEEGAKAIEEYEKHMKEKEEREWEEEMRKEKEGFKDEEEEEDEQDMEYEEYEFEEEEFEDQDEKEEDQTFENETNAEEPTVGYDLGGRIDEETLLKCLNFFEKTHDECYRLADEAWDTCMDTVMVPILSHIVCQIMWHKGTSRCDTYIKDKRDEKCNERPKIDKEGVNKNYSEVDSTVRGTGREFEMEMYWEGMELDEAAALVTVKEITQSVRDDYSFNMMIMNACVLFAQKIVAISVIIVLHASAGYSNKYLTDYRFDNNYVTTYFVRKDNQRKFSTKRSLLPLTRLENKYVVRPTDLKFSAVEKKSMLFKLVRLVSQSIFIGILFFLDYVIYFILALIVKHGKTDFEIRGRHKMEINVEGNGTIAAVVMAAFAPFHDNDHVVYQNYSNEDCLPKAKAMPQYLIDWTILCHVTLLLMIFLEAYLSRIRRIICSMFYPRREKRRIIFLYNELLRQRKEYVFTVRKAVLKLALTKRLNQKYSFLEAIRLKYPTLGKLLSYLGKGKLRCLICETPESARQPLWMCSNIKCRMVYCHICWVEVQEMCWACNSARGAERRLPDDEPGLPPEVESDEDEEGLLEEGAGATLPT